MKLKFTIDYSYDKKFVRSKRQLRYLVSKYRPLLRYLKYSQKEYQKSWDEINDKFSNYIERTTGYKWFYPTYYCVVSAINPGISNWGDAPKIIRWWYDNPYGQRRITAHELIISHYFEIYNHHYKQYKLKDGQVWALAEIAAFALTSLCPETKKYWPWDISGYYTDHNYPQLVDLQLKLKKEFLKRQSFDGYIAAGIKLVKNLDISPTK
jgi:hypothetical protein